MTTFFVMIMAFIPVAFVYKMQTEVGHHFLKTATLRIDNIYGSETDTKIHSVF